MIVDSSALLAILLGEPDAARYETAIAEAQRCRMSTATFLEASIVLESRTGPAGSRELNLLLEMAPIELTPVTAEHARSALRAWRRFGKGNHPASLNFGDCFAYALAEVSGEPLLFKGEDFGLTDIEPA